MNRREFVRASVGLTAGLLGLSCAPLVSVPSATVSGTPGLKPVARNRTLYLSIGQADPTPRTAWNPYTSDNGHQNGSGLFYEPLFFYSAFQDRMIPWLAEQSAFSPDYMQLTLKLRSGVTWSDGQPFSADDVAYTLNSLATTQSSLSRASEVHQFIDHVSALDTTTVQIVFKSPSPRCLFQLAYWYDKGVYIVPKHVFEQYADWSTFDHYDPDHGLPVTTGPWRLAQVTPGKTVIDRAGSWWAAQSGLGQLPSVERIVFLPFPDQTVIATDFRGNQLDCSDSVSPTTMRYILELNSAITSFTGRQPPYGNVDWWPISLYLNNSRPPFDDRDVRWAISLLIDRTRLAADAFEGAAQPAPLTLPSSDAYTGLRPYRAAIDPLLSQYDTNKFDPAAAARLLSGRGYAINTDGYWSKDGAPLRLEVGVLGILRDIGMALVKQLRDRGIAATLNDVLDMDARFLRGEYTGMLEGHSGSVAADPYPTLRLYQSSAAGAPRATRSRWSNAVYDQIVDEMAATPLEDQPKLIEQFKRAMEIWLPELPDVPLLEWYHRLPMNTAYWTGWPSASDPYVNGAFWHLTFPLILNRLRPTA